MEGQRPEPIRLAQARPARQLASSQLNSADERASPATFLSSFDHPSRLGSFAAGCPPNSLPPRPRSPPRDGEGEKHPLAPPPPTHYNPPHVRRRRRFRPPRLRPAARRNPGPGLPRPRPQIPPRQLRRAARARGDGADPRQRHRPRSPRPGLAAHRRPRRRQDLDRAHHRQGPQLHRPRWHGRPDDQPLRRLRPLHGDRRRQPHGRHRDGRRVQHRRR